MADGATTFAFNVNDRVEFKDGRNVRSAFIVTQEAATDDYPKGYTLRFMRVENGQIALVRWAESDLKIAGAQAFEFKSGDKVRVDLDSDDGQAGVIQDRLGADKDNLVPRYSVLMTAAGGQTDLAWWDEYMLVAAA
jgi:hypothetical protein